MNLNVRAKLLPSKHRIFYDSKLDSWIDMETGNFAGGMEGEKCTQTKNIYIYIHRIQFFLSDLE